MQYESCHGNTGETQNLTVGLLCKTKRSLSKKKATEAWLNVRKPKKLKNTSTNNSKKNRGWSNFVEHMIN